MKKIFVFLSGFAFAAAAIGQTNPTPAPAFPAFPAPTPAPSTNVSRFPTNLAPRVTSGSEGAPGGLSAPRPASSFNTRLQQVATNAAAQVATSAPPAFPPAPGTPTVAPAAPGAAPAQNQNVLAGAPAPRSSTDVIDRGDELLPSGMIQFQEADINQVLDIYAELIGRTLIRPQGLPTPKITIKAQTPLTRREGIQALDSVFALNQIATVLQGDKFVKVVPMAQAQQEARRPTDVPPGELPESGTYVTHIVQLKNAAPEDMVSILSPFQKMPNSVYGVKGTSILILRDFAENVKRMMEIIEKVDIVLPNDFEPVVIPIKYALAADIQSVLGSLTASGAGPTVGSSGRSGGGLSRAGGIGGVGGAGGVGGIGQPGLNQPGGINQQGQNAFGNTAGGNRSAFASRLQSIVSRAATAGDVQILGQTKIIADERTNALLLFADKRDLAMITNIIAKLDVVLAQVLIEALIMEVNLSDGYTLGVSASQNQQSAGRATGAGVFNNGPSFLDPRGLNTLNAFTNVASGFSYYGRWGGDFDLAVNASANDSAINVLSKPRIQTSHAKEASIFVGETRPYVTGTYFSDFGAGGSRSQYQQTQIGISLSVLPLINSEGLVVMDIRQDIEQPGENVQIDNNPVPTTIKRNANAYVAVHDRDTIILGGFISTSKNKSKSGVPFLKDIPVLGALFRSTSESRRRVELVVLIRPTVLPTPEAASLTAAAERDKLPAIRRAEKESEEAWRKQMEKAQTNEDKRPR